MCLQHDINDKLPNLKKHISKSIRHFFFFFTSRVNNLIELQFCFCFFLKMMMMRWLNLMNLYITLSPYTQTYTLSIHELLHKAFKL